MEIRPAETGDAARIAEIYGHYVAESVVTFDLDAPSVGEWRGRLRAAAEAGYPVLVGCEDGRVIGYALLTAWKPRPAYRYTAEDSIYLDPGWTGAGRGRALLERLLGDARRAGVRQVIAVISDAGVEASVALHQALGFRPIGRMHQVGFKNDRWIDVDLLQLDLHARNLPSRRVEG
ncbi:MAG TPA: GNAT family N-acetyltransferase [Jiangellaceae bacterium]|jgi:L-amino acid N-acyltransferase YncA|nr:GNAT family N-acetyltransferase [Jiangellaceae bacterium]